MWRGRRIVLVAAVCALAVRPVSTQTLTEEQALERMRAEHPNVRVLDLTVRELEAEVQERSLLSNPTVSYTREDAGLGSDDFWLFTQELPVPGRRGLLGDAAGQAVTAAEASADARLLEFETGLRVAFTDLLLAQAHIAMLQVGLVDLEALTNVLRAREVEGEGSRFDRLRAERELTDLEVDLEAAEISRTRAQSRLAAFFAQGSDATTLQAAGDLTDGVEAPNLTAALTHALAHRADYRALGFSAARWETERRAAQRLRYPAASLTGGLKRTNTPTLTDSGYALTASVAVPLFNRGQAQVARAEAARARSDAERAVLGARIETEVRAAHAAASRYTALTRRYEDESVQRASELVTIATAAYEEGEYGILELLDAHRVKLSADRRWLELAAAARRASIELQHALGGVMP